MWTFKDNIFIGFKICYMLQWTSHTAFMKVCTEDKNYSNEISYQRKQERCIGQVVSNFISYFWVLIIETKTGLAQIDIFMEGVDSCTLQHEWSVILDVIESILCLYISKIPVYWLVFGGFLLVSWINRKRMHNLYQPNTNRMIDDYMTQVCAKINFRILVQDENKIHRCIPSDNKWDEKHNNIKEECCNNDNTNKR